MDLTADERPSDSPYVERIWRSRSEQAGSFTSIAESHWGIVITKRKGKTILTVRGPETRATPAEGRDDAEYFGIQFKPGAFMPHLPAKLVMDRRDLNMPEAGAGSFWLHSSAWQFPNFENTDTFVDRLVRAGLLVHDPVVDAVLQGASVDISLRTVQRRFLTATGLTQNDFFQIERARFATILLKEGTSILDTAAEAGYYDQPHLTRALKHFVGQTPAEIISESRQKPLSFLYKTKPF